LLISKPWNGSGNYNYYIQVASDDTIIITVVGNTGWGRSTPGRLPSGKWTHLALVLDSTSVKLYVDGKQSYSATHGITAWDTPLGGDGNLSLSIGSLYPYGSGWVGNSSFSFRGRMDEVAIYQQALTTGQIQKLYAEGLLRHTLAKENTLAEKLR